MNSLPLAPFLNSLHYDGFRVNVSDYRRIDQALKANKKLTLGRLRSCLCSLLAHSPEEEELFYRRFRIFFNVDLEAEVYFADIDVEAALRDLERLRVENPPIQREAPPIQYEPSAPSQPAQLQTDGRFLVLQHIRNALLVALGIMTLFLGYKFIRDSTVRSNIVIAQNSNQPTPSPTSNLVGTGIIPATFPTPAQVQNREAKVSLWERLRRMINTLLERSQSALRRGSLVYVLLIVALTLLYFFYRWMSRNVPLKSLPRWNVEALQNFRLSGLGGPIAPSLSDDELDWLADSLSYFQSEAPSRILDAKESSRRAAKNMGLLTLVFKRKKYVRQVFILEDAFSEALVWNRIASELVGGLEARGVVVNYGKFFGRPDKIEFTDHRVVFLEELDDYKDISIFLFFSNSKGLKFFRDRVALETISHWPMAVWMELREPASWDESTALVSEFNVPVCHASPSGLLTALTSLISEQGYPLTSTSREGQNWEGVPSFSADALEDSLKALLGDALPWAQACAMIQPITLSLAESLRRKFAPTLPAERVGRLFTIPGTAYSVAGIKFSLPVLAALRRGFVVSWDEDKQEEILNYLLEKIKEAEPREGKSLAHIGWEYLYERVRLELHPDAALERLVQL